MTLHMINLCRFDLAFCNRKVEDVFISNLSTVIVQLHVFSHLSARISDFIETMLHTSAILMVSLASKVNI